MGERTFFTSGSKSFELAGNHEGRIRWYTLIERNRKFTSRIYIDEENIRWVCESLALASRGTGNLCRRWGRKVQTYIYRVYQNFNSYGRFVRIETWVGDRSNAIIVPEDEHNRDWGDIADKILRFLGKLSNNKINHFADIHTKPFVEAARIYQWPDKVVTQAAGSELKARETFLQNCMIGYFNDPFSYSLKPEVLHKWFTSRWQVCSGLKITPISHNRFLF